MDSKLAAADLVRPETALRRALLSGGLVFVLLVSVAFWFSFRAGHPARASVAGDQPRHLVESVMVTGRADAPVEVRIYSDLYCPACAQFQFASADVLSELVGLGVVRVEFVPIAILDDLSPDRYSSRSANALAAVYDKYPAEFPRFLHELFSNQPREGKPGPADGELVKITERLGLHDNQVSAAITSHRFADWVAQNTSVAADQGIHTTPTVLVDGVRLRDLTPGALQAAIGAAHAGKGASGATAAPEVNSGQCQALTCSAPVSSGD